MVYTNDSEIVGKVLEALSRWNEQSGIIWKKRPAEWLKENLGRITQEGVGRIMYLVTEDSRSVDRVPETRPEWKHRWKFHYDFKISIGGKYRYIETCLQDESRIIPPQLIVVNMKDSD